MLFEVTASDESQRVVYTDAGQEYEADLLTLLERSTASGYSAQLIPPGALYLRQDGLQWTITREKEGENRPFALAKNKAESPEEICEWVLCRDGLEESTAGPSSRATARAPTSDASRSLKGL